jgi:DNA polymerase eta
LTNEFDGIYTLSAAISTNKTMSKLASGLKRPNRQTLINPIDQQTLQKLFYPLPIGRTRGLGGKLGDRVAETLGVQTVGELVEIPLRTIQQKLGEDKAL